MPRISLYGPNGGHVIDVPVPTQKGTITPPTSDPVKPTDSVHCKAVYAALRDMQTLFDTAGITEADYWSMVRSDLEIVSRTELSISMWARLSATLNACRRDPAMFNRLVAKVKAHTEHQSRLTPDTIYAIIEQKDHRWLKPSEIFSVATTQFGIEAEPKALKKVLHGLFMRGKLAHKQVGPQEWYRYLAVNWRLKNAIVVNMEKLQRRNDWNTADSIKDEMYDKYNLLTVEGVQKALDTLAESNPQMLAETIDSKQHYHWKVKSAPAPEKPKVNRLLSQVDALLGVRS